MKFYTSVERSGKHLLARGYTSKGKRVSERTEFSPTLFFPSTRTTGWTTIDGRDVSPQTFNNMFDAYHKTKSMGRSFYGNTNYHIQYIQEKFPGTIQWDRDKIHVGNIDIEVEAPEFPNPAEAKWPVTSVTLYSSKLKKYIVLTADPIVFDKNKTELDLDPNDIIHFHYPDEIKLLKGFVNVWAKLDLDTITGWNIRTFDIPYMIHRIQRMLSPSEAERLSPWKCVDHKVVHMKGSDVDMFEIKGVAQLDYLDLFKKFGYVYGTQETYRLDHIAYVVLGERKLSYDEFESLNDLYEKDSQKYVDYNIKDVMLVHNIDKKCDYITLAYEIGYKAGTNVTDSLGTTAVWDAIIYRELTNRYIVVPQGDRNASNEKYDGGFVKEPVTGFHDWVVSFDLNSLYPSLIVQMNMSPETIVGVDPSVSIHGYLNGDHDFNNGPYCVAANGTQFDKSKRGIIPGLVAGIYDERVAIKKDIKSIYKSGNIDDDKIRMLGNKQQAIKILLNSLYGALGSPYFRWYDLRVAEGITHSGQAAIQWSERQINNLMGRDAVIAIDTDSVAGDSIININGEEITIEDFFNDSIGTVETRSNDNYIKRLDGTYITPSMSDEEALEKSPVNYIMAHKVKKRFFKISFEGKEVVVTEDHSIIVEENNKLISIKPSDLDPQTHKIYKIINTYDTDSEGTYGEERHKGS